MLATLAAVLAGCSATRALDIVVPRGSYRRTSAAGVPVRMRLFDNLNHATVLGAVAAPLKWLAPVRDEVLGFVHGPGRPAA